MTARAVRSAVGARPHTQGSHTRVASIAVAVGAMCAVRVARAELPTPRQLDGIGIDDRVRTPVPRGVRLVDQDGAPVELGSYLDGKKPLVVVLAYYQCPMLCSLVLGGLLAGMKGLPWAAGEQFRVLTVSFDPRDTPAAARAKRENYLDAYGRAVSAKGWDFTVGAETEVRKLADALGFRYRWDAETKQYAHAAGVFVVAPDGRLSRTLYGLRFPTDDLRLALAEASTGAFRSTWDRVLLFCYHYDPNAQGYVVATMRLMRVFGALTVLALVLWLLRLWRAERARATPRLETALP